MIQITKRTKITTITNPTALTTARTAPTTATRPQMETSGTTRRVTTQRSNIEVTLKGPVNQDQLAKIKEILKKSENLQGQATKEPVSSNG